MEQWKLIAVLVMTSVFKQGSGLCVLDSVTKYCKYYINCTDHLDNFEQEYRKVSCSQEYEDKVYLITKNVNLDLESWNINERDIKAITFSHVNKIPTKISQFTRLKEITVTNWLSQIIDLNSFDLRSDNLKKLNISGNNIELMIPRSTFWYGPGVSKVEIFDLSHNTIKTIPSNAFNGFSSSLKHLNLSHNQINTVEVTSFEGTEDLETLDMSHNLVKEIGHIFAKLTNINEILLNNNKLSSIIEPNFRLMTKLERLNLSSNRLEFIEDDAFRALSNLREVDLSNNSLTKISKVLFWSNTNLYKLILANNKIESIESDAFKGKNITCFDISHNNFRVSIKSGSFRGIFTQNLNLNNGQIMSLDPEAFAGLQTGFLNLSNNVLTDIAETAFTSIELITDLDLSYNNLTSISFKKEDLKFLSTFNAKNNKITEISRSSLKKLTSLTKFDLSQNKISVLERNVFYELKKLEFLDLSYNLIAGSIKANNFEGLSSLQNLQFEHNRFTSIENEAFMGLKSLKYLNCAHNEITSIQPEAFKNTGSLEVIDLSHNLLEFFSVNASSISSVKDLNLNENEIYNVSADMFSSLDSLEKLKLANNNFVVLESAMFHALRNLKTLDLSENPMFDIKSIFNGIHHLLDLKISNIKKQLSFETINETSISNLDLSNNDIKDIDKVYIFKINDIEYLNLKGNKITVINKYTFRSMPVLTWVDLSSNSITYIQPGSFLHTNKLKDLNLHGNSMPSIQFGVLDGLLELETLNLSSNALKEFPKNLLHSIPMVSTIALDSNVIEHINFEEFVPSKIELITIGGNPISCNAIADFKHFKISAEHLDYHNENFHGVTCKHRDTYSWFPVNKNVTENATFFMINKAEQNIRAPLDELLMLFKTIDLKNQLGENIESQKTMIKILNSMLESQNDTKEYLKNIASSGKTKQGLRDKNNNDDPTESPVLTRKSVELYHPWEEQIRLMNDEKEKMIKEMHDVFETYKSDNIIKAGDNNSYNNSYDGLKGALYFVAVSLILLVLFSVAKFAYKYIKPRYMFKRNNVSNSQQMANIIELQEN